MRVLVVGYLWSPFLCNWLLDMSNRFKDWSFHVISRQGENPVHKYKLARRPNIKQHVFFTNALIDSIPKIRALELIGLWKKRKHIMKSRAFDICHIHYVGFSALLLRKVLKRKSRKVIVSLWGSEFSGRRPIIAYLQKKLYRGADIITLPTLELLERFNMHYKSQFRHKLRVGRFPSPLSEKILSLNMTKEEAKRHFSIPEDHITVALGYNSQPGQQHFKILENLKNLPDNVCLLVNTQFGGDKRYREELKRRVKVSGIKHRFFEDYISDEEMAMLRKATDIMIQVQKADAFSASMQEILAVGNIVITGDWLPYKALEDAFMLKMPRVEAISSYLPYAIDHLPSLEERCKHNPEIIKKISNNDEIMNEWFKLYEEVIA